MTHSPWGNCLWTAARQYMSALLLGFGVLSKETWTCSLEGAVIEPLSLGFADLYSTDWVAFQPHISHLFSRNYICFIMNKDK